MEPISLVLGGLSALSGGMSAIGSFQQGRAQTDATNRARQNQYRDQLTLKRFREAREQALYRKELTDYQTNLRESELALSKSFTRLNKREAERYGRAAFASEGRTAQSILTQGQLAARLPAGASRDRVMALARGAAGRDEALMMDNLLRARFADIETARDLTDQANSYRRSLFQNLSPAPVSMPDPTAPVMQSGPSILSLIGGLGSAALGGFSTALGAEGDLAKINTDRKLNKLAETKPNKLLGFSKDLKLDLGNTFKMPDLKFKN